MTNGVANFIIVLIVNFIRYCMFSDQLTPCRENVRYKPTVA